MLLLGLQLCPTLLSSFLGKVSSDNFPMHCLLVEGLEVKCLSLASFPVPCWYIPSSHLPTTGREHHAFACHPHFLAIWFLLISHLRRGLCWQPRGRLRVRTRKGNVELWSASTVICIYCGLELHVKHTLYPLFFKIITGILPILLIKLLVNIAIVL